MGVELPTVINCELGLKFEIPDERDDSTFPLECVEFSRRPQPLLTRLLKNNSTPTDQILIISRKIQGNPELICSRTDCIRCMPVPKGQITQ